MYKILKSQGNNSNVTLRNTETNAEINLGRLSMDILNKLEEDGHKDLSYKEEWDLEISEDIAKEMGRLAMKMTKPVRDQSKKAKDLFRKPNKEIDAMDVLLGLANYS